MSKRRTIHFSQDLFGGWTLESLTEEIKEHAKEWGVPRSSVIIDAEQDYDETPRIQIKAERLETRAEAKARIEADAKRRARLAEDLKRWEANPPDAETDPLSYIQWQAMRYRALIEKRANPFPPAAP